MPAVTSTIWGHYQILGFCQYSNMSGTEPMFIVDDGGEFTLAGEAEVWFGGSGYTNLVQQTRAGVTKTLTRSQNGGNNLPLFVGYDSVKVGVRPAIGASTPLNRPEIRVSGKTLIVSGISNAAEGPLQVILYSMNGSRVLAREVARTGKSEYSLKGLSPGLYAASISGSSRHTGMMYQTVTLSR